MEKPKFCMFHENLRESILSDLFTFGAFLACYFITRDSTIWSCLLVTMFVFGVACKMALSKSGRELIGKDAVLAYLDKLDKEK